jgi:hypothetical protein
MASANRLVPAGCERPRGCNPEEPRSNSPDQLAVHFHHLIGGVHAVSTIATGAQQSDISKCYSSRTLRPARCRGAVAGLSCSSVCATAKRRHGNSGPRHGSVAAESSGFGRNAVCRIGLACHRTRETFLRRSLSPRAPAGQSGSRRGTARPEKEHPSRREQRTSARATEDPSAEHATAAFFLRCEEVPLFHREPLAGRKPTGKTVPAQVSICFLIPRTRKRCLMLSA